MHFRSKPAAKLRWYINGEQADPSLTKVYPVKAIMTKVNENSWLSNVPFQLVCDEEQ